MSISQLQVGPGHFTIHTDFVNNRRFWILQGSHAPWWMERTRKMASELNLNILKDRHSSVVFDFHWVNNCGLILFSEVCELEWMWIMCVILWNDVIYINSTLSIACFTCSNVLLYKNVITHSRCVFVIGLIAILFKWAITWWVSR